MKCPHLETCQGRYYPSGRASEGRMIARTPAERRKHELHKTADAQTNHEECVSSLKGTMSRQSWRGCYEFVEDLLIRFSSNMLFGDSMLRRAAAASFVSMLSSGPDTVVSVQQMKNTSDKILLTGYLSSELKALEFQLLG